MSHQKLYFGSLVLFGSTAIINGLYRLTTTPSLPMMVVYLITGSILIGGAVVGWHNGEDPEPEWLGYLTAAGAVLYVLGSVTGWL
jgi:hypothetical protein